MSPVPRNLSAALLRVGAHIRVFRHPTHIQSLLAHTGVYDSAPNSLIADESIELVDLLAYSTTRSRELALAPIRSFLAGFVRNVAVSCPHWGSVDQSNRFDFLSCTRRYGHLGWYSVNEFLHFGQYQLKSETTLVQEGNSRFQRFLCGCSFEALYESSWVQAFRAGFRAVKDRVATPKSVL